MKGFNLHEKDVLVAIVSDHVVVQLYECALFVFLVEISNVASVDFVLGLDRANQPGNGRRNLPKKKKFENLLHLETMDTRINYFCLTFSVKIKVCFCAVWLFFRLRSERLV